MSQTYSSAVSPLPLPLPALSGTPTILPSQVDHHERIGEIGGEGERRYHQGLIEQQFQQGDIELIWEKEQQKLKEREATQERFATLFEPPTPRPSPILLPPQVIADNVTGLPLFRRPQTPLRRHSLRISHPNSISSDPSCDSGSFVYATEDPLSFTPTHEHLVEGGCTGGDTMPSAADAATPSLSSSPKPLPPHHLNATLDFFGTFTHHAKQRSSAARSQILDELLLHEDDPMWFVLEDRKDVDIISQVDPLSQDTTPTTDSPGELSRDLDETAKQASSKSILLEIDHDYFRSSPVSSSHVSPRALSPMRPRMPSRSGSISAPVVAPLVACQLPASPESRHLEFETLGDDKRPITLTLEGPDSKNHAQALKLDRSSSFNSLSSKLMSSLLRGSQLSPPSSSSKLADALLSSKTTLDHLEENNMSASTVDPHQPVSDEDNSLPARPIVSASMSPALEERVTHPKKRIPFAPAVVTHSTSPFAATIYGPPSGAPGFKGDRYDWDKGFSDELESERGFTGAGVHNDSESDHTGGVSTTSSVGSRNSGSRAVWGIGLRFRPIRAGKPKSQTPSPPSSVLLHGHRSEGSNSRTIPPFGEKIGSDYSDWQHHYSGFNRHERDISTSSTDTGSIGGMGDLIERKVGTIELAGRNASSDPVLTPELASKLRAHLPALSRLPRSWTLIYSLDQHGISLNTLYSRCEAHLSPKLASTTLGISKGMLLAIKDNAKEEEHKAVFGAWIAEGLKLNKGKGYSGGGESFLWKYVDGILNVFKATGKNNYVALCEPDYISFGGGDGHYGLYLDDTLFEGSSASCPTFDNEPLCTSHVVGNLRTAKFECLGLEVWGMT